MSFSSMNKHDSSEIDFNSSSRHLAVNVRSHNNDDFF